MKNIDFIQSVVDYIDENMSEALDLDAIAVATGYSKYHLCRMFAFCTGYSIHEYVRRRRLTEAARRLVLTEERIIDISMDCGYSNQQSFTNGFESVFGETPAQYRKNKTFSPVQLKLRVSPLKTLQGDHSVKNHATQLQRKEKQERDFITQRSLCRPQGAPLQSATACRERHGDYYGYQNRKEPKAHIGWI